MPFRKGKTIRQGDLLLNPPFLSPLDNVLWNETSIINDRVYADGGYVKNINFLNALITNAKTNDYYNDLIAGYSPDWGIKGATTASKLYSIIGAGQDLVQTTGSKQPDITVDIINGYTGLTFDGISHIIQSSFTYARPETVILMGFKQLSWTNTDFLFDGNGTTKGAVRQTGTTPDIGQIVGFTAGPISSDLAVGAFGHVRSLFNHTTSNIIQVDGNAEVDTPIAGEAANMDGFTLGGRGDDDKFSHIIVAAVLLLNSAIDASYAAKMTAIHNFSKLYYGTP